MNLTSVSGNNPVFDWKVAVVYAIFAIFSAQQKFCLKEPKKDVYYIILGYFSILTSMFGMFFLIYYGFRTIWWHPFLLFGLGMIAYLPFSVIETWLDERIPVHAWGKLSFIVAPCCAVIMIYLTP
ncbi:MAG: hypothetical protein NTZ46_10600 [Verrucomicrobia bacterium]|nr:hypothetical protein [Verrucomicrobiota bacterium]